MASKILRENLKNPIHDPKLLSKDKVKWCKSGWAKGKYHHAFNGSTAKSNSHKTVYDKHTIFPTLSIIDKCLLCSDTKIKEKKSDSSTCCSIHEIADY